MATKSKNLPVLILGYDLGTGGASVVAMEENGRVLARASTDYGYGKSLVIAGQPAGVMMQHPEAWEKAVRRVSGKLWKDLRQKGIKADEVIVSFAGQMHGAVLRNRQNLAKDPAILWCDDRDGDISKGITEALGAKVPQRFTGSRIAGMLERNMNALDNCTGITTPAGWLHYRCGGQWYLDPGDASGMLPVDPQTLHFPSDKMEKFQGYCDQFRSGMNLRDLLPGIMAAGNFVGKIDDYGKELTGAPVGSLMVPPTGDQPAALAGSLIYEETRAALSVGTSIVLNALSLAKFSRIYAAVDHFLDPSGYPFNMVWVKNGLTGLDLWMEHYRKARGEKNLKETFAAMMPRVARYAKKHPDCGGLRGVPFLINEPGAGFDRNGLPFLVGMNQSNFAPEAVLHLAFLLPLFGMRNGMDDLEEEGACPQELVVTGGIAQSPGYAGPVIASVANRPVFIPAEATEGTAVGAANQALYAYRRRKDRDLTYQAFMADLAGRRQGTRYLPDENLVAVYGGMRRQFRELFQIESLLLGGQFTL